MAARIEDRTPRSRQILDELIQEQGLRPGDYALFFVVGEGTPLPGAWGEIEEASGFVVTRYGKVFAFWLGWDAARQAPGLTEWKEIVPEQSWPAEDEYQRARVQIGLPRA